MRKVRVGGFRVHATTAPERRRKRVAPRVITALHERSPIILALGHSVSVFPVGYSAFQRAFQGYRDGSNQPGRFDA